MAGYINWMQMNQPIKGDLVQIQGNPASDHEVTTSGVASSTAPEGAAYASVWSTVAATIEATNLIDGSGSYTIAIPASVLVEIPNIKPNETTITITDI